MEGKSKVSAYLTSVPVAVAALTVAALLVRLYMLPARGFWFDEVVFAYTVRISSLSDLISYINQWSDHTPLSFLIVWITRWLGSDEVAVRLPFVIIGALTVPSIYALGKTLFGRRVGIIAALVYALSPFAVFHSQDAHPYVPLMLFTTLQVLFAYRAAVSNRLLDWAGLAIFTLLNLYNHYLSLAVTAVVITFLGIAILANLLKATGCRAKQAGESTRTEGGNLHRPLLQIAWFGLTALVVFILYLPWLPYTVEWLGGVGPVRTYYVTHAGPVTLDDVRILAHGLGFDKFLVFFLFVGTISAILSVVRHPRLPGLLLLTWVGGPLAGLWWLAGERMFLLFSRYYTFLVPAAIILIALGGKRLAAFAATLRARFRDRPAANNPLAGNASGVAFVIVTLMLLVISIPLLMRSYSWPKLVPQDFRGAARIVADSPPGSVVVSIGMWGLKPAPPFTIQGIAHYLWLDKSPIRYLDASLLDVRSVEQLTNNDAVVWGAWELPWPIDPQYLQRANEMGLEVIQLENIALIRQRAPRASPSQQLDTLLAWGTDLQPGLEAVHALLNPAFRDSALGDDVLPPLSDVQKPIHGNLLNGEEQPDKWVLWGDGNTGLDLASDTPALVLTSTSQEGQTNITLSTSRLIPGATYVMFVHYRNTQLRGTESVYLSTYDSANRLIETFPYGSGFLCPPDTDSASAFALKIPPNATNELLWLRVTDLGTADFTDVELRPVRAVGR